MKMSIRRAVLLALPIALSFLFTSCPLPITEKLVAALEDEFAPSVTITSHSRNDFYYSTLLIEGVIEDDAITRGDGKGALSSLSFYIDNDSNYRGGISLDSEGTVSQDFSKGAIPIDYPGDGTFSFTVFTSGLSGDIEVDIVAIDLNGNVDDDSSTLRLRSSEGPALSITTPDNGSFFSTGELINLTGTLSDSLEITDSIEEIAYVRFMISPLGLNEELDLDDLGDQDPSDGMRFFKPITFLGSVNFEIVNTFFNCSFYPPDTGMDTTTTITIEAEDRNGNITDKAVTMFYNDGGPLLNIELPTQDPHYYSNNVSNPDIPLKVNVKRAGSNVTAVEYRTEDGGVEKVPATLFSDFTGEIIDDFTHTYNANVDPDTYDGDIRIEVIASAGLFVTTASRTIYNDSFGPQFLGFDWNDGSGSVEYAKGGDEVSMIFSLYDAKSGVDNATLSISGTTDDGSYNSSLASQNPGPYSLLFSFPAGTAAYPDGLVPYTLEVYDSIGNRSERTAGAGDLIYYHEPPADAPAVAFTKTGGTGSNPGYIWYGETLNATVTPGRDLKSSSRIRFVFSDGSESDWMTHTESPPDSGNYPVSYVIQAVDPDGEVNWRMEYEDKAGNTAVFNSISSGYTPVQFDIDNNDPELVPGTFEISTDYYDSLPPSGNFDASVVFECTDGVNGSGIPGNPRVQFMLDGSTYGSQMDAGGTGTPWTASITVSGDIQQKNLTARVMLTDAAGNTDTISGGDSVLVDTVGPSFDGNPTIVSNGVTSGDIGKAGIGDQVSVSFNLDELQIGSEKPVVRLNSSTGDEITIPSTAVNAGSDRSIWTATYSIIDAEILTDTLTGVLTLEVDAKDVYQQSKSLSFTSAVTVDNVKPTVDSWSVSPNPAKYDGGTVVDVEANVSSDAVSVLFSGIPGVNHTDDTDSDGFTVQITLPSPTDETTYTLDATVTDDHGNTGSGDRDFIVNGSS